MPEVSQVLAQKGILPACFAPADQTFVKLLQVSAGGSDEAAAAKQNLSLEQLQAMKEALEALQGEMFEAHMTKIMISESLACAVVALPPVLPCACKSAHVILGMRHGLTPSDADVAAVASGSAEGLHVSTCPRLGSCLAGFF